MDNTAQRMWIEGLNRGDVSAADRAFAPNCAIHINGSPEPNLSLGGFKEMMRGLLVCLPRFSIDYRGPGCSGRQGDHAVDR